MAAAVNLMTERALLHAAAQRTGRAWATGIVVLIVALLCLSGWTWQRRNALVSQHEALEARYAPIRQLTTANRLLSAQAAELVKREWLALQLSRRRPVNTLLAIVTDAIAKSEGAAYLERITYADDVPVAPPVASAKTHPTGTRTLVIQVISAQSYDPARLIDALTTSPLTGVQLMSSESVEGDGPNRKRHTIQCEAPSAGPRTSEQSAAARTAP